MNNESGSPPVGPRNLLLQTGEHADCDESACMDLLGVEEPAGVDVLFVTFTKSASDRLDALKRHADAPPAKVGVVSVEVGGSNGGDRAGGAGGPTVRRISDPSDLTGVGIAISEFLSAWSGDGNRTVVCFESLTALLQYVDASRVFQFCNEITSKFEQAGATAHFHITPGAHERQELSVLSSLFDGRVSAADLGYGPDAGGTTGAAGAGAVPAANEPADEPAAEMDEASGETDAPAETEAGSSADDPFEYVAADDETEDSPAGGADADGESTADVTGEADVSPTLDPEGPADDDAPPDSDPADLVTSIMAGENPEDTDSGDGGPALDADVPDPEVADEASEDGSPDGEPPEGPEDSRLAATPHQAEREEMRRRLEYVGPDAASTDGAATDDGEGGSDGDAPGADGDDPADRSEKYAFYQRTTATVVGVVVMLVLISFLSAGMPVPMGTDAPAEGDDVTPTATPEEVAAADAAGAETTTATATEGTATPTPTATATPTSDDSTDSTSDSTSGSSDDGSTATATPTPTPEPTATPTPTPTDTPSDDDTISDTLDTDDDGDML